MHRTDWPDGLDPETLAMLRNLEQPPLQLASDGDPKIAMAAKRVLTNMRWLAVHIGAMEIERATVPRPTITWPESIAPDHLTQARAFDQLLQGRSDIGDAAAYTHQSLRAVAASLEHLTALPDEADDG